MPTGRQEVVIGVVNGILYAAGGWNPAIGPNGLNIVEAYDPATNTWTTKASMPTVRHYTAGGVVNGILYVVGGHDGTNGLTTVEAYDPVANAWTTVASMPSLRWSLMAGVINGVLYAVGGYNGTAHTATVEAFTPAASGNIAPIAVASASPTQLTSTNGTNATATFTLNGSGSFDPDPGTTLTYQWLFDLVPVATTANASVTLTLGIGTHEVDLIVSDGLATDSDRVTVTVFANGQQASTVALGSQVNALSLPADTKAALNDSLNAAASSFAKGNTTAGANQLKAFQNKVKAQSGKKISTATANALIAAAQKIINAAGG